MRCLWITRQDPRPADSGELIYTLGLLRSLAARSEVSLTVLAHQAKKKVHGDRAITWELHGSIPTGRWKSLLSPLPADACRLGNPVQRGELSRLLKENWDWVIVDQAACAWSLGLLDAKTRVAYIAHNHEASVRLQVARDKGGSLPLKLVLRWDAWKYARMERALARRARLITAITPRDADAFRCDAPETPVAVLLPGFDGEIPNGSPDPIGSDRPRTVVLAGAFEWIAKRRNLEAFLQAADAPFRQANIGFDVVGKADPAWFASLAGRYPWARFTANVPSVAPYLANARIGLIPEALGGGFKLKALDYIFRGLPLASVEAALSGVPVDPVKDAISAPDPASLAKAVAERIDDLAFLNEAAARALANCREAFRWEDRGRDLANALLASSTRDP